MYWPPKAPHRKVLWAFVRIAFVVSAGLSWFNAFASMKGRERDSHAAELRAIKAETSNTVLRTQLEDVTRSQPPEPPDSLRRRAKKLADDIDEFWEETYSSTIPRGNGRPDATGEQADVNRRWTDYLAQRERLCLSRFGAQIVGIPKEMASKGIPMSFLDRFESGNNLRCLYGGSMGGAPFLSGTETEILRVLSYRLDARGNPVQF